MQGHALLQGLLVGLVFGVPAGAIGALTVQRAIAHGFSKGFVTGLGSSAADLLYACVGLFGLTVVSDFLLAHRTALRFVGGGFILILGAVIFRKRAGARGPERRAPGLPACFGFSFAIAMANPATVLSFFAAFAALGIAERPSALYSGHLLLGTGCWWALLSGAAARFHSRAAGGIGQRLN